MTMRAWLCLLLAAPATSLSRVSSRRHSAHRADAEKSHEFVSVQKDRKSADVDDGNSRGPSREDSLQDAIEAAFATRDAEAADHEDERQEARSDNGDDGDDGNDDGQANADFDRNPSRHNVSGADAPSEDPPPATARGRECAQHCGEWTHPTGPMKMSADLPNVMLISDSVGAAHLGYYENVKSILGPGSSSTGGGKLGNANVQHTGAFGGSPEGNSCGNSFGLIACAVSWRRPSGWSVIHFNWGLRDICNELYGDVTLEEYADNMERLYHTLHSLLAPGGTLIWASTTPVSPSFPGRSNADVRALNERARKLFGPDGKYPDVVVHDLYSEVVQRCRGVKASVHYPDDDNCPTLQLGGDVHFNDAGKQFTAVMTAAAILPYLTSPP